jgi:hypothetical protein
MAKDGQEQSKTDVYLGDGLCAAFDGYQVELYASNGVIKTNQVYLEPAVLTAFLKYVESLATQKT